MTEGTGIVIGGTGSVINVGLAMFLMGLEV